jgi:predicted DNA-binding protein
MPTPSRTATAIRFPDEMHDRLKQAADARGLSINFLVVLAVEELLERLRTPEEFRDALMRAS